jgi:hypothetical protein
MFFAGPAPESKSRFSGGGVINMKKVKRGAKDRGKWKEEIVYL